MSAAEEKTAEHTPDEVQVKIIWLLRITLPIILFTLWFWSQGKEVENTKNRHPRNLLLFARQVTEGAPSPDCLVSLTLMPEVEVQKALGGPPPRPGGGPGGGRGKRSGGDRPRLGGGGTPHGQRQDSKSGPRLDDVGGNVRAPDREIKTPLGSSAKEADDKRVLTSEEQMHLESLLNFVAFSYKDRPQRVFLPASGRPPPPRRRPPTESKLGLDIDNPQTAKANAEAQMVLKGAVNPKIGMTCPQVAKYVHQQLEDADIVPTEATFSLLVEVCVNGEDLKTASDLLMKMESSGHSADSDLLDKVMDLYSRTSAAAQNSRKAQEASSEAAAAASNGKAGGGGLARRRGIGEARPGTAAGGGWKEDEDF